MIHKVYNSFIASDYSDEGNTIFYEYIQGGHIKERQFNGHIIFLATHGEDIVGVMEVRNNNHISLLFVDKEYQGKGIAKILFRNFLNSIPKTIKSIDVHASPFSIPVYEKLGFEGIGEMKEQSGIKYREMIYVRNK